MLDKLISIRKAASILKSTPYTIQQLIIDKKLDTRKAVTGKTMVVEESVIKYKKSLEK